MTTTKEEGVVTIHKDGELIGIIYNDMEKRSKILYSCLPMTQEEIVEVITGGGDSFNFKATTEGLD
jgi:hypothetical protein